MNAPESFIFVVKLCIYSLVALVVLRIAVRIYFREKDKFVRGLSRDENENPKGESNAQD